jgi:hypothetical protein
MDILTLLGEDARLQSL